MSVRQGENEKRWLRSDRVCKVQNKYYFTTREGSDVGPFTSLESAQSGLEMFVETILSGKSIEAATNCALYGSWSTNQFE